MLALGVIDVGGSQSARRKRTCPSGRSPYPFKYNRSGGIKAKRTHKKTNKHKPLRRHKWLQVMITRRIKFNFWTFTCIYKTFQYEIHHYDSTIYKFLVKILLWYNNTKTRHVSSNSLFYYNFNTTLSDKDCPIAAF